MNNIAIFVHAAILPRCDERLLQYFLLLRDSQLLDKANHIFIDYIGIGDFPLQNLILNMFNYNNNIHLTRISEDLSENEAPTHKHLFEFAKSNSEYKILYLHTKGVGKIINLCIEDWVHYMTYFLIEKWEKCTTLLDNNNTVGVDLSTVFHLHYSGNFWWSTANHINNLVDPLEFKDLSKYPNAINSVRHAQEFWICSKYDKHICLWQSNIPVSQRHIYTYSRFKYS